MNKNNSFSRRRFIGTSFSLAAGATLLNSRSVLAASGISGSRRPPGSLIRGVQIGVITYSYRSMPDQSVEGLLKDILADGINAVELMGDPAERYAGRPENPTDQGALYRLRKKAGQEQLAADEKKQLSELEEQLSAYHKRVADWRATVSMDRFAGLRRMYNEAGVNIYAWKPGVFGKNNSEAEVNYAFNVAKALGAAACTAEHPRGADADAQTERLGRIAARHRIYMSYHAHTQASPTLWDKALKQSRWNAVNLDVGHWVAAGNPDPVAFIRKYHGRIESMHLKDRTTPAHGDKNLPWGQGDTPLVQVLRFMRDQKYTFPASVELEYQIPEGSNAVKEVADCVAYCRKALEG